MKIALPMSDLLSEKLIYLFSIEFACIYKILIFIGRRIGFQFRNSDLVVNSYIIFSHIIFRYRARATIFPDFIYLDLDSTLYPDLIFNLDLSIRPEVTMI